MKVIDAIFLVVVLALIIATAWFMSSCGSPAVTQAPSISAVRGDVARAQTNVTTAKSLAERIHDKDVLIDRWNETHRVKP